MIFHVGEFRKGKADFMKHLGRSNNDIRTISYYCASTSFPVAAAVMFALEELPEHKEELERTLAVLKDFYGYEDIIE